MNNPFFKRTSTPKNAALLTRFYPPVTPILSSNGSNDSYESTFDPTNASMREDEKVADDSMFEEKENEDGQISRERSLVGTPTTKNIKNPVLFTPQTTKDRQQRIQRKHSTLSDVSSEDERPAPSSRPCVSDSPMDITYRKPSALYNSDSDEDVKVNEVSDSLIEEKEIGASSAPFESDSDDVVKGPKKKGIKGKSDAPIDIDSSDSEAPIVIASSDSDVSLDEKDDIPETEDEEDSNNSFIEKDAEESKSTINQSNRSSEASENESIKIDESMAEAIHPGRRRRDATPSISSGSDFNHDDSSIKISASDESDILPMKSTKEKKVKSSFAAGDSCVQIDDSCDEILKGRRNKPVASGSNMTDGNRDNTISIDSSSEEEDEKKHFAFTADEKASVKNMSKELVLQTIANLKNINLNNASDGGKKAKRRIALLEERLNAPFDIEIVESKSKPEKLDLDAYRGGNKRLYGGKMTDKRQEAIAAVTDEVIEQIHGTLDSMPDNVVTETPSDLTIDLMLHQKHGLTWMKWRETAKQSFCRGGILADDMGLGKTLSMISLIVSQKSDRKNSPEIKEQLLKDMKREFANEKNIYPAYCTLVVAPASVIYQWEKEIKDRVKSGKLKVYVFHGPRRERDPQVLARNDVVITTYNTISSELGDDKPLIGHETDDEDDGEKWYSKSKPGSKKVISKRNTKSVLTQIGWERIVLDEAHQIKNRNSLMSKGCCRLHGLKRWALTGTPIHNELWDFYSLVRFLRITPFCDQGYWKNHMSTSGPVQRDRLNTLVKSILLRRTKNQICSVTQKPLVDLKPRKFEIVEIQLEGVEEKCYQHMMLASQSKAKELINQQSNLPIRNRRNPSAAIKNPFLTGNREIDDNFQMMSCLLVLLLRLRQACVHMTLTKQAVDLDAFKEDGGEGADDVMDELEKTFGNISLGAEEMIAKENQEIDKIFEPSYESGKLKVLLEKVNHVIESGDKCVIVSQWTSMLDIVEQHLKKKRIILTAINGKILTKDRQDCINSFNKKNGGAQVMLLSLTAGGVGLNLVGGNHLFLLDLHWNPALEQQAMDRIYQQKMELATSVLEGAAKKSKKLNINDLKFLFGLTKEQQQPKPSAPKEPYQGPNNIRIRGGE
uniref:Transcription termination factor 2 n=1 Tax=Panagrolaimus sp. PS1159 TaxID=55785 RepID=A0AC35FKG8_9BILA